jgi:integrase
MLTGCREAEIAKLLWSEISFDENLIKLPSHRTKNAKEHWVPLVPATVEILQAQPRGDTDKVFAHVNWTWRKSKLDKMINLSPPWVIHDLRRTFSTGCREYLDPVPDEHLVEICLNHMSGTRRGVAGVYDRSKRLAERRRLLERWAEVVLRAAGEPVEGAKVVNMP